MSRRRKMLIFKARAQCLYCKRPIVGWVHHISPEYTNHGTPISICPVCFRILEEHFFEELCQDLDRFCTDYQVPMEDWR